MVIDGLHHYASESAVARDGKVVQLRAMESRIFGLILRRQPAYVRPDQIREECCGTTPRSSNWHNTHVAHLNKKLAALGVRVVAYRTRGYVLEAR